jgi:hypothetical protein
VKVIRIIPAILFASLGALILEAAIVAHHVATIGLDAQF